MKGTKQKAVINAEKSQLDRMQRLISKGRYRTVSEFVREAVEEELERLNEDRLADSVERYCAAGYAEEDTDLTHAQAIGSERLIM